MRVEGFSLRLRESGGEEDIEILQNFVVCQNLRNHGGIVCIMVV